MHILFSVFRFFLTFRYRVSEKGLEVFDTNQPVIVFPNHPALVDPMLIITHVGKKRILSPVMTETYIRTPGLGPILKRMGTIPVGDIARGGSIENVKKAFGGIRTALDEKKNVLIYPSGHIYVQPFEDTTGKKMAYEVVGNLPKDARIVVIRTKGLWGSIWGKAYYGRSPELMKVVGKSIWFLVANLFFFIPKRDVSIEYTDMTDTLLAWSKEGLDSFNNKLADYYNEGGNETCRFIPHYAYYNDVAGKEEPKKIAGSFAELAEKNDVREEDISKDTLMSIYSIVSEVKKIPKESLEFDTRLILDLHADSLDMAEMKSMVQNTYKSASNPPVTRIKTVGDLAAMALGLLTGEETLPPLEFQKPEKNRVDFIYKKGDTILSRAIRIIKKSKDAQFLYDAVSGPMKRGDFLLKAYVVAAFMKRYKEKHIGIMMPALAATSLLIFSTYLAKKLPVMLNWTVGEKSFAHCMNFAGLETILTSRKFYEKIRTPWLAQYESKMVFLEDVVKDISTSTKVCALIMSKLGITPRISAEAVMLFTSGSESLPKAVVLSHENILTDIEGAISLVPFDENETIIGFLPPFHSFGFTINTIFPLVANVQGAYTPDPGDARTIGKIIKHTGASIISATPTFLRMILSGNEKDTLISLKYAFVGAEKCSDDVFKLFHEKCQNGCILEGYGITECSPIVTVNPLQKQKKGSAGKFLPSLMYRIRSLDNTKDMPIGEQGMIFVRGPSIFSGYLDTHLESPFEEFDAMSWYKTGDLGFVDNDGFLFITGRLKRFVKIAGEMISLPFIEGILLEKYGNPELTTLAIEAKEENGNVTIVAFTTISLTVEELNEYMHTHGASNLVKISRVDTIDTIPVLGTGKTDYKQLKSRI